MVWFSLNLAFLSEPSWQEVALNLKTFLAVLPADFTLGVVVIGSVCGGFILNTVLDLCRRNTTSSHLFASVGKLPLAC